MKRVPPISFSSPSPYPPKPLRDRIISRQLPWSIFSMCPHIPSSLPKEPSESYCTYLIISHLGIKNLIPPLNPILLLSAFSLINYCKYHHHIMISSPYHDIISLIISPHTILSPYPHIVPQTIHPSSHVLHPTSSSFSPYISSENFQICEGNQTLP